MAIFVTENSKQTQELAELLAVELRGGEILCLEGDLGAGKTTFAKGLLKGLKIKGPHTSPTFLIMKEYKREILNSQIKKVYHIDAYRVGADDLLNLCWEEIIADKKNVVIVEWPERIESILPKNIIKISFEWLDENKRKIIFKAGK